MNRHELLRDIHRLLRPRSYLEIGVRNGGSLTLSRTQSIAIDPGFRITEEIRCDLRLVRATSDEFFALEGGLDYFDAGCIDLAFIDGRHLIEFALRDFMNVERHAVWTTVVVFDDVLPRNVREPQRTRTGMRDWTGDVYKIREILAAQRPDLLVLPVDVEPTGALVVLGADPGSRVLESRYDAITAAYVRPDPQEVPESVLRRLGALDAKALLGSPLFPTLRKAREAAVRRDEVWERVRRAVEEIGAVQPRALDSEQLRPRSATKDPRDAQGSFRAVRRRLRGR